MKKATNDIKASRETTERPGHSGFHISKGEDLIAAASMGFDFYTLAFLTSPIGFPSLFVEHHFQDNRKAITKTRTQIDSKGSCCHFLTLSHSERCFLPVAKLAQNNTYGLPVMHIFHDRRFAAF